MTMTNSQTTWDVLIDAAWQARERAYAPYSGFRVGANCAERTAMFQAVANGAKEFHRMVICADTPEPIAPCGACRQVMVELAPQMEVLLINQEGKQIFTTVEKLMPYSFSDFPQQTENDEGDV